MSEQLNKEMEELEELEEVTANAKTISATNPSSVKLKQEKEDMQKAKTSGKTNTLSTKGDAKSVKTQGMEETELEGEVVEEEVEEIQEMPKLKSEMLDGIVAHMKSLKKEDLAKIYGTTVLGEEDEEEEDEDEDEEEMESKKVAKESIDQVVDS